MSIYATSEESNRERVEKNSKKCCTRVRAAAGRQEERLSVPRVIQRDPDLGNGGQYGGGGEVRPPASDPWMATMSTPARAWRRAERQSEQLE